MAFYDLSDNEPGKVASRLGQDAVLVARANGPSFSMLVQNVSALVAGLAIAFSASWRLTLLILAAAPLMVLFGGLEMKAMMHATAQLTKAFESAAQIATEAMGAHRTVAAFNLQPRMYASFAKSLEVPTRAGLRRARFGGLGQGGAQFVMMCTYAMCFYVGAQLIKANLLSFTDLLQSFFAISMAATGMGHSSAFAVDAGKADAAKRSIFALLERPSAIDGGVPAPAEGTPGAAPVVAGRLEFRDVTFAYPTRPDTAVLKGLSLVVEPGA